MHRRAVDAVHGLWSGPRVFDGDPIAPKEVVLRIRARYRRFGLYDTWAYYTTITSTKQPPAPRADLMRA